MRLRKVNHRWQNPQNSSLLPSIGNNINVFLGRYHWSNQKPVTKNVLLSLSLSDLKFPYIFIFPTVETRASRK
jgi:hypothetical protein